MVWKPQTGIEAATVLYLPNYTCSLVYFYITYDLISIFLDVQIDDSYHVPWPSEEVNYCRPQKLTYSDIFYVNQIYS